LCQCVWIHVTLFDCLKHQIIYRLHNCSKMLIWLKLINWGAKRWLLKSKILIKAPKPNPPKSSLFYNMLLTLDVHATVRLTCSQHIHTFVNSMKKTTAAELNGILPFTLQMFSRTPWDPYKNALIKIKICLTWNI
jgi:hypothetical protein